jgi:uncharacterized membrane protein
MRPIMILASAALGGLFAASSTSEARAFGYTFTDISVPGSQPYSTGLYGIGLNNLGQVAGSYNDNDGNSHGFLYTAGKYVTIDAPGAIDTYVYGINDWGQIVGTSYYSNGSANVFIDTHGTFANIADGNAFLPLYSSLNDRDQVFGEVLSGAFGYGVLSAHGVITPVNLPGAYSSAFPDGFNNLDQFAGTVCDSVTCHGFIDTKDVFKQFDYPNALFTGGNAINDLSQVVGEYENSSGDIGGYLYSNGHFTMINDPSASPAMDGTDPLAINDLGEMAGWYYDAQGNIHAFLATPSLDLFAATAAAPLADAVPEPSTWVMMLVGMAGLGFVGRRRASTSFRAK